MITTPFESYVFAGGYKSVPGRSKSLVEKFHCLSCESGRLFHNPKKTTIDLLEQSIRVLVKNTIKYEKFQDNVIKPLIEEGRYRGAFYCLHPVRRHVENNEEIFHDRQMTVFKFYQDKSYSIITTTVNKVFAEEAFADFYNGLELTPEDLLRPDYQFNIAVNRQRAWLHQIKLNKQIIVALLQKFCELKEVIQYPEEPVTEVITKEGYRLQFKMGWHNEQWGPIQILQWPTDKILKIELASYR